MQEHLTLSCLSSVNCFFLVVVTTNCVLKERCENIQEHSRTHGWFWKGVVKNEVKVVKAL